MNLPRQIVVLKESPHFPAYGFRATLYILIYFAVRRHEHEYASLGDNKHYNQSGLHSASCAQALRIGIKFEE